MAGGSKNNPSNKNATHKVKLVLSNDCDQCNTQCVNGLQYIAKLKSGKTGNGVKCNK